MLVVAMAFGRQRISRAFDGVAFECFFFSVD